MVAIALFASFSLAVFTLASPLSFEKRFIQRRDVECNSFASVTSVPTSFTLLAVDKNDTSIRRPLGLGVISGYQPGVTVVGTTATIVQNYATNFTMVNSSIISVPLPGSSDVQLSMYVQTNSGLLEFMSKAHSATRLPVASYCEELNTSPHGVDYPYTIDVYGDPDNFSICTTWDGATDVVVYEPVNGTALAYDGKTCAPVTIHAIHCAC